MDAIATMLQAIARDPGDDTAWLALSDVQTEAGQDLRAEMVRVQLALRRPGEGDPQALERRLLELWSPGVPPCLPKLSGPAGMEFHLIPPGTFWQGAPEGERWMDGDEYPRHQVTLARGFYLGVSLVTRKQWAALTGANYGPAYERDHPIEDVTRPECEAYCDRLADLLNRPCRLPTEAEWEYACRAGTTSMFFGGDDVEALQRVGWCSYDGEWDSCGGTQSVMRLAPNAFGLYDMHGNVWEWCADWYTGGYYSEAPSTDPPGPSDGVEVVIRGGSYRGGPWFCRSAERRGIDPGIREINVGLRVAIDLE